MNGYQRISGSDPAVVERRAQARMLEWERRWERIQESNRKSAERERERQRRDSQRAHRERKREEERAYLEERKTEAEEAANAAEQAIAALEGILEHTLHIDDRIDFESLKDYSAFSEASVVQPAFLRPPPPPRQTRRVYQPGPVSFFARVAEAFSTKRLHARMAREAAEAAALQAEDEAIFAANHAAWTEACRQTDLANARAMAEYEHGVENRRLREQAFLQAQAAANAGVDKLKAQYEALEPGAIEQYCDLVLSRSDYPDCFPKTFQLQYRPPSRMVVVDYVLPAPDALPRTKSVKYVAARDEMVETELPERDQKRIYDSVVYQLAIRTLHELFEADAVNALDAAVFNGFVETIDVGTGHPSRPCIVSVQAGKQEFLQINLHAVEPKACFKRLKGFGSAQLAGLAAIAPVVQLATEDPRYVDSHEVMSGITEGMNLATMDWEEFV